MPLKQLKGMQNWRKIWSTTDVQQYISSKNLQVLLQQLQGVGGGAYCRVVAVRQAVHLVPAVRRCSAQVQQPAVGRLVGWFCWLVGRLLPLRTISYVSLASG